MTNKTLNDLINDPNVPQEFKGWLTRQTDAIKQEFVEIYSEHPPVNTPSDDGRPDHWDEDTWGEVNGHEGYGDGWADCGPGTYTLSVGNGETFTIIEDSAFDAVEAAYAAGFEGYIEVESWGGRQS